MGKNGPRPNNWRERERDRGRVAEITKAMMVRSGGKRQRLAAIQSIRNRTVEGYLSALTPHF